MALTLSNSNYNGEVLKSLYLVTGVGNEVMQKGAAKLYTGIAKKLSLPKLSQTSDPIEAYTTGVPTGVATTSYVERSLDPNKMTVYETFIPSVFLDGIWKEFQSQGDLSNIELNSELLKSILDLYKDNIGIQMSKLFFQGKKTGGVTALSFLNGIITRAAADGSVVKPTPAGEITAESFADILAATWNAIPNKYLDDPDFALHMNTTDWKIMQNGNTKLKESFVGVFGMGLDDMYNLKRIKHFQGMPRHHILGARVTNDETSNLNLGVWVDPSEEAVVVDRVAANSKTWFLRVDFQADANYRCSEDLVLYEPS